MFYFTSKEFNRLIAAASHFACALHGYVQGCHFDYFFLFLQGCKYAAPSKFESSETKIEEIDVSKIEGLPVPTDLVNCIGDRNTGPLKLGPIPNPD